MESAIPPSYSEATTRDHWALIAGYIASSDLCAASLVSRRWHEIFASCLWGNPAGHFGTENDRVYIALTRFKRSLPTARLKVRQLTHTLHLPPALSEIHDGPKAEWLRDILEQLPNLQSLVVAGLPVFDHGSLLALRQPSTNRTPQDTSTVDSFPLFPLRLLIATRCANATSAGLAEACLHWQNLVFLDLSNTSPARDNSVLSSFRFMRGLQVLKLQNIGLRDDDVEVLAEAIHLRVRSLDISDNRVTDLSVRTLLNKCFHTVKDVHREGNSGRTNDDDDWPSGTPRPDPHIMDEFRGDDLDERLLRSLTRSVVRRIAIEDMPRPGITHLWIRNNFLSVEGVASLLRSENLYVLDAAAVDTAKALGRPRARSSVSQPLNFTLPGVEKLTPVLEQHASKNLTFLRINHAVVTEPSVIQDDALSPIELGAESAIPQVSEANCHEQQRHELEPIASNRFELAAPVPVYELEAAPRYELPAQPVETAQPSVAKQKTRTVEDFPLRNEGPAFAPEVVVNGVYDEPVILTATGLELPYGARPPSPLDGNDGHVVSDTADTEPPSPLQSPLMPEHNRNKGFVHNDRLSALPHRVLSTTGETDNSNLSVSTQIAKISGRRQELRHGVRDPARGLLPGRLSSLRTLVLTEVPCRDDASGKIVSALKKFISDCALEAHHASQQAALEYPNLYIHGRPRSMHQSHRCSELFALRSLVLEMAPDSLLMGHSRSKPSIDGAIHTPNTPSTSTSHRWSGTWQQLSLNLSRSSTEDRDVDQFWEAQQHDFSFFEDEECGLPVREPGRHFPRSLLGQKMLLTEPDETQSDSGSIGELPILQRPLSQNGAKEGSPGDGGTGAGTGTGPSIGVGKDVVAELAKWRREKKKLAESEGRKGRFVEGYWKGEVKVVRHGTHKQRGFMDWYGNNYREGGVAGGYR